MENIDFYKLDLDYLKYLQETEKQKRGFTRVPNMEYGKTQKPKFMCGIILQIHGTDYYVPVSSYKIQKPDNFIICADAGHAISSLRFNYMIPVPKEMVTVRKIENEPDRAYRSLLSQELRYCIKHQATIRRLAERTYHRVILGKNPGLVKNSCDFAFLEQKCCEYKCLDSKKSLQNKLLSAQEKADTHNQNVHKEYRSESKSR